MATQKFLDEFDDLAFEESARLSCRNTSFVDTFVFKKGEDAYVFFYDKKSWSLLHNTLGRTATNPELNFDWLDVYHISSTLRCRGKSKARFGGFIVLKAENCLAAEKYIFKLMHEELLEEFVRAASNRNLFDDISDEILRRIAIRRPVSRKDRKLVDKLSAIASKMDSLDSDGTRPSKTIQQLGRECRTLMQKLLRRMRTVRA